MRWNERKREALPAALSLLPGRIYYFFGRSVCSLTNHKLNRPASTPHPPPPPPSLHQHQQPSAGTRATFLNYSCLFAYQSIAQIGNIFPMQLRKSSRFGQVLLSVLISNNLENGQRWYLSCTRLKIVGLYKAYV